METWSLTSEGFAFIHYFTRNETGTGRMNFKSSAVTKTKDGTGISYDKSTLFPTGNPRDFQLRIREDQLDIDFVAPRQHDVIHEAPMTVADHTLLQNQILPLYPGLQAAAQWSVKKTKFSASLGNHHQANLIFYALWPDISPENQQMEFFGQQESYTFSSPMLVTVGQWSEFGSAEKTVVGLSFLDRQWSKDYFGKHIFANPLDFLKKNHALGWAHNWSAFHAKAVDSNDWYFVHVWQQVRRKDDTPDQRTNYTGIQWSKNGQQQPMIDQATFTWQPRKFVENQSKVLLNFAEGRKAFFPVSYHYSEGNSGSHLEISASPQQQSLDQPIYLYEGYASGQGLWDNQTVQLQGRVESSQILFRDIDYDGMLRTIDTKDSEQRKIAYQLENELNRKKSPYDTWAEHRAHQIFLSNDLGRKFQIFNAQFKNKPKRQSPTQITYY
jgi:hypothetical protein